MPCMMTSPLNCFGYSVFREYFGIKAPGIQNYYVHVFADIRIFLEQNKSLLQHKYVQKNK